jgi:phage terminase large subunit-like protein
MASATTRRRPRSRSSTSSRSAEPAELDDFASFCGALTLENGEALELHAFQRRMLADYFAAATETLILLPKKNGKSTLLSALALYHLVVTEDAECVIAAASRDQASIMLRQARGFIRRSEPLRRLMEVKQREITSLVDDGRIRVLASDVDTADGVIPTLALVDELHRHKSADLYGVFRDGLGPRHGRMITISTAGDDSESPLGRMRSAAYALPTLKHDGTYRYARSGDGAYVLHEWALEPEDDRDDMRVVKRANPAPWHTLEALGRRRSSPSMTEWQWARFACGVWLQGEDTAIGPVEWAACGTDDMPEPSGAVRIGLDLGFTVDTTGVVAHWLDENGVAWVPAVTVLVPPSDGTSLRKSEILKACAAFRDRFGATEVVLDPETGGRVLAQDLEDAGFDVVAHSQKPSAMATAAERLHAAIREGTLHHPRDPVLNRHALNAHRKSTEDGRWRFVKETKQSRKVIDALIALAMVHSYAVEDAEAGADFVFAFSAEELAEAP